MKYRSVGDCEISPKKLLYLSLIIALRTVFEFLPVLLAKQLVQATIPSDRSTMATCAGQSHQLLFTNDPADTKAAETTSNIRSMSDHHQPQELQDPQLNSNASEPRTALPIATDCFGCGVCCLHMGYPAFMLTENRATTGRGEDADIANLNDDQYWNRLPDDLREQLVNTIATYDKGDDVLDGPCIWLNHETMLCGHHEYRPRVCRDFEIGSRGCRQWREHYRQRLENSGGTDPTQSPNE